MEDSRIIELYWERSEMAISETEQKYGRYCRYIANNVLHSDEDTEECVNDTYVRAWNSMPPERPQKLPPYLGKITRNVALDRLDYNNAKKRSPEVQYALEELAECLCDEKGQRPEEDIADSLVIKDVIDKFLKSLPLQTRVIFVRRYWYMSPVAEIAADLKLSCQNVKVILHRTRNKLRKLLEKEGISV